VLDLEVVSEAALSMAPLPMSAVRLAELAAGPSPDFAAIVEVVRFDQSLTVALLRAANSSWSYPRHPIATVNDAVIRLGAGQVMTLALGLPLHDRLNRAIPEYGLDEGELWRHSAAASLAAETLTAFTTVRLPKETPTAALLHDVGKLVISRFVEPPDQHAIDAAREIGITRIQVEGEVLGVDHAELGALIAQVWELPASLTDGILHHHSPEVADSPLAFGVHLADVVAKTIGQGADDNADLERYSRAMGELGLTADAFDEVCSLVSARFAELTARYE
jgi:putative nucleotidyltransferase with HDIG domain